MVENPVRVHDIIQDLVCKGRRESSNYPKVLPDLFERFHEANGKVVDIIMPLTHSSLILNLNMKSENAILTQASV